MGSIVLEWILNPPLLDRVFKSRKKKTVTCQTGPCSLQHRLLGGLGTYTQRKFLISTCFEIDFKATLKFAEVAKILGGERGGVRGRGARGGEVGRAPLLYETLLEVEQLHFIIENLLIRSSECQSGLWTLCGSQSHYRSKSCPWNRTGRSNYCAIYQSKLLQMYRLLAVHSVLYYRLPVFLTSLPATFLPAAFLPKGKTSH